MGAGNAKMVFANWGHHLPDRPRLLLVWMALVARDDAAPPTFWGGREMLAVGLGRKVPDDHGGDLTEAQQRERHAAFEAVRTALQQLICAGALTRIRAASPGRTAEYALNLKGPMGQAKPVPNGAGQTCATGQAKPAQRGRPNLRMGQAKPAPEENYLSPGLTSGVATHPSASPSGRPWAEVAPMDDETPTERVTA